MRHAGPRHGAQRVRATVLQLGCLRGEYPAHPSSASAATHLGNLRLQQGAALAAVPQQIAVQIKSPRIHRHQRRLRSVPACRRAVKLSGAAGQRLQAPGSRQGCNLHRTFRRHGLGAAAAAAAAWAELRRGRWQSDMSALPPQVTGQDWQPRGRPRKPELPRTSFRPLPTGELKSAYKSSTS